MTTVVYHKESNTLAVDSRATVNDMIVDDECNKAYVHEGILFVVAGSVADIPAFIDAYLRGTPGLFECVALAMMDGQCFLLSSTSPDKPIGACPLDHNLAIGSGDAFAMTAMDCGKTAVEAVEFAKKRDCFSGGEVHSWTFVDNGDLVKVAPELHEETGE